MSSKERRQREKQERKKQILDAARKILFKKGMAAVSMNMIAKQAELSVGTLYLYFTNKEELFAALQEEGLTILHDMIKRASDQGDTTLEKLQNTGMAYFDFSKTYKNYFDITNYFLTAPEVMFPDPLKERIDKHGDRILSVIEGVINGSTPDSRRRAVVFWATLQGILQLRKLQNTILSGDTYSELYTYSVDMAAKAALM